MLLKNVSVDDLHSELHSEASPAAQDIYKDLHINRVSCR